MKGLRATRDRVGGGHSQARVESDRTVSRTDRAWGNSGTQMQTMENINDGCPETQSSWWMVSVSVR